MTTRMPCLPAFLHGSRHLGAQWVGQADQSEQLEIEIMLDGGPGLALVHRLGDPEHSQAAIGQGGGLLQQTRALLFGEMTEIGNRFRRALGAPPPDGCAPEFSTGATWPAAPERARTHGRGPSRGAGVRYWRDSRAPDDGTPSPSDHEDRFRSPARNIPVVHETARGISVSAISPSMSSRVPSTVSAATAMRFSVSVPVLSTHRTVVSPSVSMALRRRVNTR